MDRLSPNLMLQEPDSSVFPHILLWICQLSALASGPFPGRRMIFSFIIISLAIYCNLHPYFTKDFQLAQPFSISWSFYLATLAKLLFSASEGPEDHFWRVDKPVWEAQSYDAFGVKKLRWAAALIFNQRGIRWSHQVKNIPESPNTSKRLFLRKQLLEFIACFFMADLCYELHRRFNFTSPDGEVGWIDSKHLTMHHPDVTWRLAKSASFAALPYFMLRMQYAQGAFLAVLLGLTQPEDWPPMFGSFEHLRTVRSFWGSFWHQQLRHMLTSYTDAFTAAFAIRRGCNLSSYTKLYLAFGISGTFHALGQLCLPRPSNITAAESSLGFLYFFAWQAAAITLEDIAIWATRKSIGGPLGASIQQLANVIGYSWVLVSMWCSIPLVGDMVLRLRVGTTQFSPFPLTRPIVRVLIAIPE